MQLSVVLPCYNEEANIRTTFEEVLAWAKSVNGGCEIIAVDDGSSDETGKILAEMVQQHPFIKVVTHAHNQGYGRAIRSGCDASSGEWIAFMDSDGQFRIEDLGILLPYLQKFAFVTGRRRHRADPLPRVLYGKVLAFFNLFVFGMWIRDVNCGLKVFRREIWKTIRPEYGIEKLFNTEMFLRLKRAKIAWKQVAVPHHPRRAGVPTGASGRALQRMVKEVVELKKAMRA